MASPDLHRRRSRSPERSRAELLRATRGVAADRGFDATRFSDVAAATGVPISSLQYYFGTRDGLVREAVQDGAREELHRLQETCAGIEDPVARLSRIVRLMVALDDGARREGWLVWMEFWRTAMRDPELNAGAAVIIEEWRAFLREAIDDGVRAGAFHLDGSVEDAVTQIMALLDGLGIPLLLGHDYLSEDDALRIAVQAVERLMGI